MSDDPKTAPPEYSIEVRSYELHGATPFTKPAVHNELVFLQNGKPVAAFNGDPYARETGAIAYPSLSNRDTLRVSAYIDGTTRAEDPHNPFRVTATGTVFTGGKAEFAELLGRATDAAHSINNSSVDYVMLSIGFTPQNSNSAVGTMLQAMGLQPPASLNGVWSPGGGRSLLPQDFQSSFTGIAAQDPDWLDHYGPAREHLVSRLQSLTEGLVRDKVRADPNPHANYGSCGPNDGIDCTTLGKAGQLFDPQKPSASPTPTWRPAQPPSGGMGGMGG